MDHPSAVRTSRAGKPHTFRGANIPASQRTSYCHGEHCPDWDVMTWHVGRAGHCTWHRGHFRQSRRSAINLGEGSRPPLSLLQSSFLPFPLVDSPGVWAEPVHPLPKHFDAIYTVRQPYTCIMEIVHKVHKKSTLMFKSTTGYRNQRTCRVQLLSAELILWITGHV